MAHIKLHTSRSFWPSYRTVWRWHFYAGLFAIPFILWLSVTGSIYLFKPQIERFLDRPYDHLVLTGPRAQPQQVVAAAVSAVPGSNFHAWQLPNTPQSAIQILVGRAATEYRVYLNPQTTRVLKIDQEDRRPMQIVQHLHGEFLLGDRGSLIIELAASWAIVLIVTGLYLWWPRQAQSLAGVLYPRLRAGQRIFWRDLHSVTGIWISAFALFILFSGLPWAKSWGGDLKKLRSVVAGHATHQDWITGSSDERAQTLARNQNALASAMPDMPDMPGMAPTPQIITPHAFAPLPTLIATVTPLHLPYPVLITPPKTKNGPWGARSDTQDRPLRVTLLLDPRTGAILHREGFAQHNLVDRIVAIGVAAHEGQLFTPLNQLVSLATALGLILICISAIVLWWRRRETGILGAPTPVPQPRRASMPFVTALVALCLYLPMLGISLLCVLLTETLVLRRIPATQRWLGLQPSA